MLKGLFICLLVFFLPFSNAQETRQFRYNKLGENLGLNSDFVYNATQDAQGQMWFSTQNGLYTYDNKQFTHYPAPEIGENRNLNNILYGVYYDPKTKLIWCSSLNAFMFFDPEKRQFISPDYKNKSISDLADNQPFIFYRDSRGTMWLGTQKRGLGIWNETSQSVDYLLDAIKGVFPVIFEITETKEGVIWAASSSGLIEVKPNRSVKYFSHQTCSNFTDLEMDNNQNCLWLGTSGKGLFRFDLQTHEFLNYKYTTYHSGKFVNDGIFQSLAWLEPNLLIVEGNMLFDTDAKKFSTIDVEFSDFSFKMSHVEKSKVDREGNVWLCTYSGLYQLSNQNQNVRVLNVTNPYNDFGVEIRQTIAINNTVYYWCDEYRGLLAYDLTEKQKRTIPLNLSVNFRINAICKYDENTIWLATNRGVFAYNILLNNFKKVDLKMDAAFQNGIIYLYINQAKNIYATVAQHGLFVYRPKTDAAFVKAVDLEKKYPMQYVSAMAEDSEGHIWCVSPNGIFRVNSTTLAVNWYVGKLAPNTQVVGEIISLVCDPNNHVWFVDLESGLSEMWVDKGKINVINHALSVENGLKTQRASGLVLDKQNQLWVASMNGLFCVDIHTKKIKARLRRQQGLLANSFERNLCISNHTLVIPDWSKFQLIDLNKYQFNALKPNLILSNIKIGKGYSPHLTQHEFSVPFNEGFISLNVGSTSYTNGNQNAYYYQLLGIDKEPIKMGSNYSLSYSGLAPGKYVLRIWAENCNAIPSDITEIAITVNPPFYKTWWFLLLTAFIVLGLVYYLYAQRLKTVRKEARLKSEYLQKIAETEMKALRAQMNPHFMFNAMNSIQKYILKNEPQLASQYLTKFSRLIRVILEQSQKKSVSIAEEKELLMLYTDLESMRFDNQFEFKFQIEDGVNPEMTMIPTMILQPYIENAIWHGLLHKTDRGMIVILVQKTNDSQLKLSVVDNGVGRAKAAELNSKNALKSKSYGMQITHDRLNLFNQNDSQVTIVDLFDENNEPSGTKIEIVLPFIENKA